MNRRSFLSSLLTAGVEPLWLKGSGRIWKPVYAPVTGNKRWVYTITNFTFDFKTGMLDTTKPLMIDTAWEWIAPNEKDFVRIVEQKRRQGAQVKPL
jgi:hypothetical protein